MWMRPMSNKLEMVPFHPEHVKLMQIREQELKGIFAFEKAWEGLTKLHKVSIALTMCYDGRILGSMGFLDMWPGVCEVWVIPSRHLDRYGLVFARAVKRNLQTLIDDDKMHRIQVTAIDDNRHNRWLEWLGFKCEGVMKNYSYQKQDFKMWSRT